MFNQFLQTTTSITVQNMPVVAMKVKNTMLSYKYASNCPWYTTLQDAKSVKDIFDLFGFKFEIVNNAFVPVVENFSPIPNIMEVLKAVAPYMENGNLFVADEYDHYYTINFNNGVVTGKKRTKNAEVPAQVPAQVESAKVEAKKPEVPKTKKSSKKPKKENAFKISKPQETTTITRRDDNTYTVQELVIELLKQMDAGNASKLVTIEADFLFSNEKYA